MALAGCHHASIALAVRWSFPPRITYGKKIPHNDQDDLFLDQPVAPAKPLLNHVKDSFQIDRMMDQIREAMRAYRKAALFELADDGFNSAFEQLVACIISIRTRDEDTVPLSRRLFALARTPAEMSALTVAEIDAAISGSTFHGAKAPQIHEIARRVTEEYDGQLPCELDKLLAFRGVGIKCAHLVLGIACGQPRIGVDIHVHRITNRWGYVATSTPEKTTVALEKILPPRYWVEINALLVPFGKHVCTGAAPRCSTCPVLDMCNQVGVTSPR